MDDKWQLIFINPDKEQIVMSQECMHKMQIV